MSAASEAATVLLKKRERTQNWIPEEKSALFALIKHHVSAIENKKIDAAASAMKTLAWQQIYYAFRGRFSADRDITRIREQWRRMKAQARMEMYTYAEKVRRFNIANEIHRERERLPLNFLLFFSLLPRRAQVRTLGPEVAAKSRPSNLSIEVWRLMESVRKNDCEIADRSDDSSQDNENPTSRLSIHAILDKLTLPAETSGGVMRFLLSSFFLLRPDARFSRRKAAPNYRNAYLGPEQEIKIEVNSDTEDENSRGELSRKASEEDFSRRKRPRITAEDEPVDLVEQKVTCPDSVSTSRVDDGTPRFFRPPASLTARATTILSFCFQAAEQSDARNEMSVEWNGGLATGDKDRSVQRATWIFKSTQREHELKLRMLHIELERAELQKQTAVNELKTSELKKQLIQDQVDEYYRCRVRSN